METVSGTSIEEAKEIMDAVRTEASKNESKVEAATAAVAVTPEEVQAFVKDVKTAKMGDKTTVVQVTLLNGFEIVETASCVDPSRYDEKVGTEIAFARAQGKIWEYLGFLKQHQLWSIGALREHQEALLKKQEEEQLAAQKAECCNTEECVQCDGEKCDKA